MFGFVVSDTKKSPFKLILTDISVEHTIVILQIQLPNILKVQVTKIPDDA